MIIAHSAFCVVLAGALVTGLAPTALDFRSTSASLPTCEANSERTTVSGDWTPALTHLGSFRAVPGTDRRLTGTAPVVRRLTSKVTGIDDGSLSARQILEKAAAEFGDVPFAVGKRTADSPQAVTFRASGATTTHRYALFQGRRLWKGTWSTSWCAPDGKSSTVVHHGTWRAFSTALSGSALCSESRYGRKTLQYKACKALGR